MLNKGSQRYCSPSTLEAVSLSFLPPPTAFDLPHPNWRDGQEEAIAEALGTDKQYVALALPTGAGKSLVAMTLAHMEEGRTAIITSTKALQRQYSTVFSHLSDIRGKANYPCEVISPGGEYYDKHSSLRDRNCDLGPCTLDYDCKLKVDGCSYFDTLRRALKGTMVLTNYAYWLSSHYFGDGLGKFGLVVIDEAHAGPSSLAGFFNTTLTASDLSISPSLPPTSLDPLEWASWARGISLPLQGTREQEKLKSKITRLQTMDKQWIVDDDTGNCEFAFDPRTPVRYADHLFQDIPKVVLVSATVRPKTCELLGIDSDDLHFFEAGNSFPVKNRRLIHIPTVRVNYETTPEQLRLWCTRIDQIISGRLDRKGILHTVSYSRARFFARNSKHKAILITHGSADTGAAIERVKKADAPAVLVSPATPTGYDFPDSECRFQIIGKIPFPPTQSKIMKARCKDDKELSMFLAMQELVQMVGRGVRSVDDWCENLLVDDSTWFLHKWKRFSPSWFLDGYRSVTTIPTPPKI